MNFESKYLIRWGIPGWVLIFLVLICLTLTNQFEVSKILAKDPIKALSILITFTGMGVPIGYILHQVYFFYNWVSKKNKKLERIIDNLQDYTRIHDDNDEKEYQYLEYLWQSELTLLEKDTRDYIAERYRHLLSTTHSLGVLVTCLSTALITSLGIFREVTPHFGIYIYLTCNLL